MINSVKTLIKGAEEKIKAKYSIEYLKKMISGSKLSEDVVIKFNKDYPFDDFFNNGYQLSEKKASNFIRSL